MSAQEQARDSAMDALVRRWDALRILGQRDFYGVAQSAGGARKWVVALLSAHVSGEVLETIELLVGEVVANAVVHSDSRKADGLVTVFVGLGVSVIHIEVIDDGSATSVPEMRTVGDDSLNGRGLGWVDLLASVWGTDHDDKARGVVWFQLAYDAPILRVNKLDHYIHVLMTTTYEQLPDIGYRAFDPVGSIWFGFRYRAGWRWIRR